MKTYLLLFFILTSYLFSSNKTNDANELYWWKTVGQKLTSCESSTFTPCQLTANSITEKVFKRGNFDLEGSSDKKLQHRLSRSAFDSRLTNQTSKDKFNNECKKICSDNLDYMDRRKYIKQKTNTLLDSALEKYKMKVTNNIFIRGEFFENLHEKSILDKTILNDMSISYLIENPKEKVFNNKIKIKIDNHSKLIYYGKKNMSLKNYNECINLTKDMVELLTSKYILNKSSKYIHQTNMMTDTSYLGALQGSTKKRKQTIKVTQLDSVLHEQTAKITCTKNVLSLEYQDEKILKEVQNRHKKIKESNLRQKKNKEQEIETKRQQNSFKKLNDSL